MEESCSPLSLMTFYEFTLSCIQILRQYSFCIASLAAFLQIDEVFHSKMRNKSIKVFFPEQFRVTSDTDNTNVNDSLHTRVKFCPWEAIMLATQSWNSYEQPTTIAPTNSHPPKFSVLYPADIHLEYFSWYLFTSEVD